MGAAALALLPVVGCRPPTVQDAFLCILVETLAEEFRAVVAALDTPMAAALFGDGRDAAVALQAAGAREPLALGAQRGEQACPEHGAGARQGGEDRPVGMLSIDCRDLLVIPFDGGR